MIRRLFRDWRFRTLVPIVVIHAVAFVASYSLAYRFALREVVQAHREGAARDISNIFYWNFNRPHNSESLRRRTTEQAAHLKGVVLTLVDADGSLLMTTDSSPRPSYETEVASGALLEKNHVESWTLQEAEKVALVGIRVLSNEADCRGCHAAAGPTLGAIEMRVDVTSPIKATRKRLKLDFGIVVLVWIGLVFAMIRIRDEVIGRPLARMEEALRETGAEMGTGRPRDLNAMATRLHDAIWGLIADQQRREQSITRRMARAEQLAALGELAAGLTHEIRNPLAGIIAAVEVLRSEESGGTRERESVYEQILAELARVNGTVDGLLRLGRPQVPQRVQVDLGGVVRNVSELFEVRLKTRRVSLTVEVQSGLPELSLDAGMMTQLLVNLLTNSLDAVDTDGKIGILLGPFPKGDGVALVVSDTGKGIAPEDLDRVFDTFFTTKEHGTGLGLSICRRIVEQHGGTISVESGKGEGTKVMVLLPAPTADETAS